MEIGKLGLPLATDPRLYSVSGWDANYFVPYGRALNSSSFGAATVERLKGDARVAALHGKMIARGAGAEAFDLQKLGMWYLWRANLLGTEVADAELELFLTKDYVQAVNALWITGLDATDVIELLDGFCIIPAAKMPETRDRASFMGYETSFLAELSAKPRVAIVTNSAVKKTWGNEPTEDGKRLIDEFMAASSELYDIALVINTCRGAFCLPHYSTSYLPDSLPYGPFGGSGGGHPMYDVVAHGAVMVGSEFGAAVARVYKSFRVASKDQKSRFRLILDRLSQAKRRQRLEDKILDLGIALEMLLLRDNASKDQLSQSFRLCGAWLLGKTAEQRHALYTNLKHLYLFRSEVAHGGVLSRRSYATAETHYIDYQTIAEDVCTKIICDGEPKWEMLLLGVS